MSWRLSSAPCGLKLPVASNPILTLLGRASPTPVTNIIIELYFSDEPVQTFPGVSLVSYVRLLPFNLRLWIYRVLRRARSRV
jgi:hypothetical protein